MKKKYFPVEHEGMFWVDVQWRDAKKEEVSEMYCSTISMARARKIARALNKLEKQIQERVEENKILDKNFRRWLKSHGPTNQKNDRPSRGLDPYPPGFGRRKR